MRPSLALERVNLCIPQGQICCIYGESGSGKSTLLNQLAGMEKPTKGGVRITGVPISRLDERQLAEFRQKHLGFVFQSYNLLPNLNAIENVAMPLMFRGVPKRKRETIARAMLKRVGLGKRMNHYPTQMSGGQQQRVGIARAFVTRPPSGIRRRADRQSRFQNQNRSDRYDLLVRTRFQPDHRARHT